MSTIAAKLTKDGPTVHQPTEPPRDAEDLADDLDALAGVRNIGDLVPYGRLHQARRRAKVRAAMEEAVRLLQSGLAGEVPLEAAVYSAFGTLASAEREVLRKALSS